MLITLREKVSMLSTARQSLAQKQAELVHALVAQGPVPTGFDESRLRTTARSLVNKRRQALARVWPSLVEAVGQSYVETFTRYAEANPLPACPAPRADGRAFLGWLEQQAPLSDAATVEAVAFDLRCLMSAEGLRPRRFAWKITRLPQSGRRLIAVRLPWLGERWWGLPAKG